MRETTTIGFLTARGARRLLAVSALALTATAAASARAENHVHMTWATSDGGLRHGIRYNSGFFTGFGDVEAAAGDIGWVSQVASTLAGGRLHVVAAAGNHLWHAVRNPDSWNGFQQIPGPNQLHGYTSLGVANVDGVVHVCGLSGQGTIRHAVLGAGGWTFLADLASDGDSGFFRAIDCAGIRGDLHLVLTNGQGATTLQHNIRFANGAWSGFGDIFSQTGRPWGTPGGYHGDLVAANVNGELHVVYDNLQTYFHTIRRHDGSWYPFGDIQGAVGDAQGDIGSMSATAYEGELLVSHSFTNANAWLDHRLVRRMPWGWDNPWNLPDSSRAHDMSLAGHTDTSVPGRNSGLTSYHWRSINDMPVGERQQLANLLREYVNDAIVNEHANAPWHHNGDALFLGHRGYLSRLENFLIARGAGQFVPLPYWDPASRFIPAEFMHVEPQDNGVPRRAIPSNQPNTPALPADGVFANVCNFATPAEVASAIEASWHDTVHVRVGGAMDSIPTAAAALLFYPWHSFVDNVYSRWFACKR